MSHRFCCICGEKMKDALPYSDSSTIPDMCKRCQGIQDVFIERRLKEKKDSGDRRRKTDKGPPG